MSFDPNQLAALSAILRLGSFDAAAEALSVTPSAISQRIRALEERVGTALIHRGTPCTGTPAGQRVARHAEDIALLEAGLSRELSLTPAAGPARLRIAVTADSLATWVLPALAEVEDVLFDLVIDDQDHSGDWLRRGEVSAAITAGGQAVAGCDAHALGSMRYLATASPAFLRRWFPDGITEPALRHAPCLTFNLKDGLQRAWIARHFGTRLSPPSHFLPDSHAFVEAAARGLGWGMNPHALARDPIRAGRLVAMLDAAPLDIPLTWQVSRVLAPALAPLTRAIRAAARTVLIP